jgi:hypothetical protein
MRNKLTFLVATVLVAVVVVQVNAQEERQRREGQGQGERQRGQGRGGFRGFGGGGQGGIAGLLRMEEVQKEIELLDDQLADIEKMQEELRGQRPQGREGERRNFQDLSDEERQKLREEFQARAREQAKKTEKLLAEILLPHQMDRLKELVIQQSGARALLSAEVAEKLGVSEDKRKEIEEVLGSMRERMQGLFQRGEDGERPDFNKVRAKMQELNKEIEKESLAKLTESQREQFAKMKGEPFKFPERRFGGRGGERGRRGGEGDGGKKRPKRPDA